MQIEDVYDAAFDRQRFNGLIERLVHAFGAQAGFLAFSGPETVGFQAQYGNDPFWLDQYVSTYWRHDLLRPKLMELAEGVCANVHPLLSQAEVRESIFYREYVAPQGIIDNLAVNLIKQPALSAHLALLRREPADPFDAAACRQLETLVPHLRRAVYIQSHLVRAADHLAAIRSLVGDADGALLMLDGQRRVIDFDPPLGPLLGMRPGEAPGDNPTGRAIVRAMDGGEPVAVDLTTGVDAATASVLLQARPLERGRFGDLGHAAGAAWVIHVTRVDQPRPIALAAIGELYHLTPTELRVLGDAIAHGDLPGIGARLGMARATARTHLHRIYDKTSTGSFAALTSLVHRFTRLIPQQQDT